jgi:hypothetical protein
MCLIGLIDTHDRPHLMEITESALPWAYAQGWSLVFRYRDDPLGPHDIEPHQRNPNRTGDDEC